MRLIQKENGKYKIGNSLILLFSAPFIVWQMGVLYYSGTTMSLFGRTPIPLTQEDTIAVIAAGYIVSMLFMCLFPKKTILAERILLPVAFTATVLMLFPFSSAVVTVLFYIEAFICTFSIGTMVSVAANQFTVETTWRDGVLAAVFGGTLIALLQNDLFQVSFTAFTILSILLIALNTLFYYLIPAKTETEYVSTKNKVTMPKILFFGLWVVNAFSTLLLCLASSFAESVPHGISVLYLSAAIMTLLLHFIRKRFGAKSIRIYGIFFALSILGFVLAYLSISVPALRYVALGLLAFNVVLAVLWIFFAVAAFQIYPTRFIGVIGAGVGIVLAAFHSGLQEALRNNIPLLYGIYAALSVVLLIVYFILEPYFTHAWNKRNAPASEPETPLPEQSEKQKQPPHPFDCLSEQERILAALIMDGYTESSAAKTMNITLNTEKGYRKSLYFKLDIHSKRELFEIANQKK